LQVFPIFIERGTITNLKVAGESGFSYKLCFASRKDWPELTQILNKGLASLSSDEKHRIYNRWIHYGAVAVDQQRNPG